MFAKFPDFPFMAPATGEKTGPKRPRPLHTSRSFSRIEPTSPKQSTRIQRASTIQNGVMAEDKTSKSPGNVQTKDRAGKPQSYEQESDEEEDEESADEVEVSGKLPADFDELPIELISLTDSFLDSLSAKVHPTPPTIDKLHMLFQDFYVIAATHINTHISALSSRQHRKSSPAPVSTLSSATSKFRAKATSISSNDRPRIPPERKDSEQQMLTPEEIADRKRARKVLEHKRVALEEAVERRVCEGIYDRIWRHRSTQDEAQDQKLGSKTAALSVVGIGLADLGVDLGVSNSENPDAFGEKEKEVREWLEGARKELMAMNSQKYPLGKLHHLKAAYKAIVDTLSHFHPSSSADEIMPMMIYTLITSPPEGADVISNFLFIQRFRNENKMDGEAAYCLTTLEAAIAFLENVDLPSLRADEKQSGPEKSSSSFKIEKVDPMIIGLTPSSGVSAPEVSSANASPTISKAQPAITNLRPSVQPHNRRLSDMFQPPAALGAAGDAVLNSADQSLKNIGNSLGDSYKFLVGKLKERDSANQSSEIVVPKTLDDARKLITTPPPEDDGSASGASSLNTPDVVRARSGSGTKADDKVLSIIGGRKLARDRSTDSNRSASSARKVAFAEGEAGEKAPSPLHATTPTSATNPANVVESMRNLGNSLNPMNKFAGIGMMRFGRPTPPLPPTTNKQPTDGGVADLTTTFPDLAPALPPKEISKIAPPIKRFMEIQNPGELRINEVLELLRDYRRLAGALKDIGAVQ